MINFIKGILFKTHNNSVIVDVSGIGYEIFCPLLDVSLLSSKTGQEVFLYTYLVHKEDAMQLYGFLSEKSKNGFLALLKVSGIGTKAAIKILSHYDTDSIFESVENEDIEGLNSIPGIGPKMAKKIIFDLKGVIPSVEEKSEASSIERDLISAMTNLGYRENDIKKKLQSMKPLGDQFEVEFKRLLKKLAGK